MADDNTQDSKVFDVAKPGSGKVDIGSKPMIIGHKSLAEDPMVKEAKKETEPTEDSEEKEVEKVTPPSVTKKVITPLSEQKGDPQPEEQEAVTKKLEADASSDPITEDIEDVKEEKVDPEVEKNERNEKLQSMVQSKKYFVTIHNQSSSQLKVFILTFIGALIIGLIGVALLIDAEILDINIELPFDLL